MAEEGGGRVRGVDWEGFWVIVGKVVSCFTGAEGESETHIIWSLAAATCVRFDLDSRESACWCTFSVEVILIFYFSESQNGF